jgi:23S rRNA pseudouridine2605 synthase
MSTRSPQSRASSPPKASAQDEPERLQKVLAAAGLGSRRQCEELILTGRVEVDRKVVQQLGVKADPANQEIRVDGVPLPRPRQVYFILNKPTGVVSTNSDPSGRPRVIDLIDYRGRLFTVGRLDMSSEGLILVTNDGELANQLTHPRYGVEKTYQVEVAGTLDRDELGKLRRGVHLAEGFASVVSAKVLRQFKQSTLLEIVLAEGRNREIRRLLARVGHKVERLKRVALGPLRLAELPLGASRQLDGEELRKLKQAAKRGQARPPRPAAAPRVKKPVAPAPQVRAIIGGDAPSTKRPAAPRPRTAVARPPRPGQGKPARPGKPKPSRPGQSKPARGAHGKPARPGHSKPGRPSGAKSPHKTKR